jgi:predicted amidophosphoribosyltransferase
MTAGSSIGTNTSRSADAAWPSEIAARAQTRVADRISATGSSGGSSREKKICARCKAETDALIEGLCSRCYREVAHEDARTCRCGAAL